MPGVQQGFPTNLAQGSCLPGTAGIYPCKQQGSLPGFRFAAKRGWSVCIPQHRAHIPSSPGQQRACLPAQGLAGTEHAAVQGKDARCFPVFLTATAPRGSREKRASHSQQLHWQLLVTTENTVRLQAASGLKQGFGVFFHVFCSAASETLTQLCSNHPVQGFLTQKSMTQPLAITHHRNTPAKTSSYLLAEKQESQSDLASPLPTCIQHPFPGPT